MKSKTRKSAAKRVKLKKNILSRKKAFKGHLLSHKSSKRLRNLSSKAIICASDLACFCKMILCKKI